MRLSWRELKSWDPFLALVPLRHRGARSAARVLREAVTEIVTYHAARPVDVLSYYEKGLRIADYDEQFHLAQEIFLSGAFPELTSSMLREAVSSLSDWDNGRAYVALDDRGFLMHSGHYLIYGSERLCAIAAHIKAPSWKDYRQVLKAIGTPTVFRIHLPISMVRESDASEFAEAIARNLPTVRAGHELPEIDFSFRLDQPLPPECVVSHFHPTRIADPLLGFTRYEFTP